MIGRPPVHGESFRRGHRGSPEYRSWHAMRQRCRDPRAVNWDDYGGRGIKVCDRWLASFPAFLEDMGRKPSPAHSLDRINAAGNYEPGNCRWADKPTQGRNRRGVRLREEQVRHIRRLVGDGQTQTAVAAAFGVSVMTVNDIIKGRTWSDCK